MKIILISIHYPPIISSCAEQIKDIATELKKKGHTPVIITSNPDAKFFFNNQVINGIKVVTIKGLRTQGNYNFLIRGMNELLTPILMISALLINRFSFKEVKGIIWYSPIIFFAPIVYLIKKITKAKTYLILRDHYPEELVNIGVLKNKLIFSVLKFFNRLQFNIADKIGVQSKNSKYYLNRYKIPKNKIEILYNWASDEFNLSYNKIDSKIKKKKVFLFLGTLTTSQYNRLIYKMISYYKYSKKIIILFVGTGSELKKIEQFIRINNIKNVLIHNQIKPQFVKSLCKKCSAGLIFLNKNCNSHNVPGKFVSYLRSGLPVVADINRNSDLAGFIENNQLGIVNTKQEYNYFLKKIDNLINNKQKLRENSKKCVNFYNKNFTVENKVRQILKNF